MRVSVGAPQSECRAFVVALILIKHSTNWWLDSHRATREPCIGVFRAGVVPSRPLAQDDSFSPEDVTALATAFEGALRTLGVDRSDPVVLSVASRMIELARHGERNPTRLRDYVLDEFQA